MEHLFQVDLINKLICPITGIVIKRQFKYFIIGNVKFENHKKNPMILKKILCLTIKISLTTYRKSFEMGLSYFIFKSKP